MSDYGDDYSDYGEDWFYVEEEYMVADDLAEHAVQSPPPTAIGDEDAQPDWDRFDYFNDIEYASDGYDDASFQPKDTIAAKTGQKRKRGAPAARGNKKQKVGRGHALHRPESPGVAHSPIVWRSQVDRGPKPKVLEENTESYALLKDWREKLADTPQWARGSPVPVSSRSQTSDKDKTKTPYVSEPISPRSEMEGEEEEDDHELEDGEPEIDPAALMAALQSRLAAAGGPLSGMDPQQLLQFAMRMATDKDAGDDIAGDLANEMLNQDEEDEEDEDAEGNLLSWVAQQRGTNEKVLETLQAVTTSTDPQSPEATRGSKRPPTPPSSEANRSSRALDEAMDINHTESSTSFNQAKKSNDTIQGPTTRKRKATDDVSSSTSVSKKRATRSYDAPTAASQARAAPAKATRSGRATRS